MQLFRIIETYLNKTCGKVSVSNNKLLISAVGINLFGKNINTIIKTQQLLDAHLVVGLK
jgi:hypothetical protein